MKRNTRLLWLSDIRVSVIAHSDKCIFLAEQSNLLAVNCLHQLIIISAHFIKLGGDNVLDFNPFSASAIAQQQSTFSAVMLSYEKIELPSSLHASLRVVIGNPLLHVIKEWMLKVSGYVIRIHRLIFKELPIAYLISQ